MTPLTTEERVARLEEKVHTLFTEQEKINKLLEGLNETQVQLLQQITELGSIMNTLKWTLTLFIALFSGIFVFIITEIIKII